MTDNEHEVLSYLEGLPHGYGQTTRGIVDRLDLSLSQVRRALTGLRRQGQAYPRTPSWNRRPLWTAKGR